MFALPIHDLLTRPDLCSAAQHALFSPALGASQPDTNCHRRWCPWCWLCRDAVCDGQDQRCARADEQRSHRQRKVSRLCLSEKAIAWLFVANAALSTLQPSPSIRAEPGRLYLYRPGSPAYRHRQRDYRFEYGADHVRDSADQELGEEPQGHSNNKPAQYCRYHSHRR